jgi:cathepsin L
MRTLALTLAAAPLAAGRTTWEQLDGYTYDSWLVEHGSRWPGTKAAFETNLAEIKLHNANVNSTWKMGVNQFTALGKKQRHAIARGWSKNHPLRTASPMTAEDMKHHVPASTLPSSLDWRTKNVVTKVKDQGGCGGCWSFSAAETMESHVAIATGTPVMTFSEQAILACTPNPLQCGGTGGCEGATQELAFNTSAVLGITSEADWPYQGVDTPCDMTKLKPVAYITGFKTLPFNDYNALMNEVQTMPIAISAAAEAWMNYETGVYNDVAGCGTDVDHAIQLVGYGTDTASGLDYYLVRNSWSAGWGEEGYIRIVRFGGTSKGEPCGTDKTPGDGDGCKGGPSSIKVCGTCGILSDSSVPQGGHLPAQH